MADETPTTTPNTETPAPPAHEPAVPYARFQEVNSRLTAMADKVKTLEAEAAQKTALEAQLKAEQAKSLRLQIAVSAGLPFDFADRLHGATAEELQADAAQLAALVKPAAPPAPGVPPAPRNGTSTALSLSNMTPADIRKNATTLLEQARQKFVS